MSFRHEIYVRAELPTLELAKMVASSIGGEVDVGAYPVVSADAGSLIAGATPGLFGIVAGPVLEHKPDGPYPEPLYEPGYFEATDFYNIEMRLGINRQTPMPPTDYDPEERAVAAVFCAVARAGFAAIHVQWTDLIVRAAMPGKGVKEWAPGGVGFYGSEAERWQGYVLTA